MQKLTTAQTEELLRLYPQLPTEIKTLEIAIKQRESPDDVIYSTVVAGAHDAGMPHPSGVSDKTQRVALEYVKMMRKENNHLKHRLALIRGALNQIDVVLAALSDDELIIFKPHYIERKSWSFIISTLPQEYDIHSENAVTRRGKETLEKVARLINISPEELKEIKRDGL